MRALALVLGAAGQLGEAMTVGLSRAHEVVALSRDDLDVTATEAATSTITSICPDVIINCAAYTNVDGAEDEPQQALAANAWALRTLARIAKDIGATLVHFSTDFVFDGKTTRPYLESDAPNPRGTYASSKLLGEWFASEAPEHYILRVESLFGGARARSSVDRMLQAMEARAEVRAFLDRVVSPSYVKDVVVATAGLLERRAPYGIYHCVNSGWTTWAGLAREIAERAGHADARINEVRVADSGLVVLRPQFAALSNAKLAALGITMPTWQDALARYLSER